MNRMGYPFEMYDHFGRFRAEESVLDLEATAKNVDGKGKPYQVRQVLKLVDRYNLTLGGES